MVIGRTMHMNILSENHSGAYFPSQSCGRVECTKAFYVRFAQTDGGTVAYCHGRFLYGASAEPLRHAILWNRHLVLDFRQVERIDAAGLGLLAQLQVLASVMDTVLELRHLNRQIRHLLRITKLDCVLRIVDDEDEDTMCAVSA